MKQSKVLVNALQDIIAETFQPAGTDISSIREIAQKALCDYERDIPMTEVSCPCGHAIGKDYYRFLECKSCPIENTQICGIYNWAWYK